MLILTRYVGETIVIGDDVRVKVLSMKGSQIKLGISAPDDVSIHREEVYERIREEQLGQAKSQGHPRSEDGAVPD